MGSFEEIPVLLTVKQLHDLTGMHEVTIRRGIYDKTIPADKIKGKWYISRDAIFPNAKGVAEHAGER
ncbi:MAG: helix-turn-helix domain-containing protein [Atopobiaceae bacterium]|nr:helix-turn-helix domain-containing protein [Atopobiaceae bacterium]